MPIFSYNPYGTKEYRFNISGSEPTSEERRRMDEYVNKHMEASAAGDLAKSKALEPYKVSDAPGDVLGPIITGFAEMPGNMVKTLGGLATLAKMKEEYLGTLGKIDNYLSPLGIIARSAEPEEFAEMGRKVDEFTPLKAIADFGRDIQSEKEGVVPDILRGLGSMVPFMLSRVPGSMATKAGMFGRNAATAQRMWKAGDDSKKIAAALDLGKGFGSKAKLAGYMAARNSSSLPYAMSTGAGEAFERAEMARQAGMDVSDYEQMKATLAGSIIGAGELAPIEHILGKIPKLISKDAKRGILKHLKEMAKSSTVEGIQEGMSNLAQNVVQQQIYDPELDVFDSVLYDAAIGAAVGGITQGLVGGGAELADKSIRKMRERAENARYEQKTKERMQAQEQPAYQRYYERDPTDIEGTVYDYVPFNDRQENETDEDYINRQIDSMGAILPAGPYTSTVTDHGIIIQDGTGHRIGRPVLSREEAETYVKRLNDAWKSRPNEEITVPEQPTQEQSHETVTEPKRNLDQLQDDNWSIIKDAYGEATIIRGYKTKQDALSDLQKERNTSTRPIKRTTGDYELDNRDLVVRSSGLENRGYSEDSGHVFEDVRERLFPDRTRQTAPSAVDAQPAEKKQDLPEGFKKTHKAKPAILKINKPKSQEEETDFRNDPNAGWTLAHDGSIISKKIWKNEGSAKAALDEYADMLKKTGRGSSSLEVVPARRAAVVYENVLNPYDEVVRRSPKLAFSYDEMGRAEEEAENLNNEKDVVKSYIKPVLEDAFDDDDEPSYAINQPIIAGAESPSDINERRFKRVVTRGEVAPWVPAEPDTDEGSLGLYSNLFRTVKGFKQPKGSGEQFLQMIKKSGVKPDELFWFDVESFLNGKKSVTKEEILKHIADNDLSVIRMVGGENANQAKGIELTEVNYSLHEMVDWAVDPEKRLHSAPSLDNRKLLQSFYRVLEGGVFSAVFGSGNDQIEIRADRVWSHTTARHQKDMEDYINKKASFFVDELAEAEENIRSLFNNGNSPTLHRDILASIKDRKFRIRHYRNPETQTFVDTEIGEDNTKELLKAIFVSSFSNIASQRMSIMEGGFYSIDNFPLEEKAVREKASLFRIDLEEHDMPSAKAFMRRMGKQRYVGAATHVLNKHLWKKEWFGLLSYPENTNDRLDLFSNSDIVYLPQGTGTSYRTVSLGDANSNSLKNLLLAFVYPSKPKPTFPGAENTVSPTSMNVGNLKIDAIFSGSHSTVEAVNAMSIMATQATANVLKSFGFDISVNGHFDLDPILSVDPDVLLEKFVNEYLTISEKVNSAVAEMFFDNVSSRKKKSANPNSGRYLEEALDRAQSLDRAIYEAITGTRKPYGSEPYHKRLDLLIKWEHYPPVDDDVSPGYPLVDESVYQRNPIYTRDSSEIQMSDADLIYRVGQGEIFTGITASGYAEEMSSLHSAPTEILYNLGASGFVITRDRYGEDYRDYVEEQDKFPLRYEVEVSNDHSYDTYEFEKLEDLVTYLSALFTKKESNSLPDPDFSAQYHGHSIAGKSDGYREYIFNVSTAKIMDRTITAMLNGEHPIKLTRLKPANNRFSYSMEVPKELAMTIYTNNVSSRHISPFYKYSTDASDGIRRHHGNDIYDKIKRGDYSSIINMAIGDFKYFHGEYGDVHDITTDGKTITFMAGNDTVAKKMVYDFISADTQGGIIGMPTETSIDHWDNVLDTEQMQNLFHTRADKREIYTVDENGNWTVLGNAFSVYEIQSDLHQHEASSSVYTVPLFERLNSTAAGRTKIISTGPMKVDDEMPALNLHFLSFENITDIERIKLDQPFLPKSLLKEDKKRNVWRISENEGTEEYIPIGRGLVARFNVTIDGGKLNWEHLNELGLKNSDIYSFPAPIYIGRVDHNGDATIPFLGETVASSIVNAIKSDEALYSVHASAQDARVMLSDAISSWKAYGRKGTAYKYLPSIAKIKYNHSIFVDPNKDLPEWLRRLTPEEMGNNELKDMVAVFQFPKDVLPDLRYFFSQNDASSNQDLVNKIDNLLMGFSVTGESNISVEAGLRGIVSTYGLLLRDEIEKANIKEKVVHFRSSRDIHTQYFNTNDNNFIYLDKGDYEKLSEKGKEYFKQAIKYSLISSTWDQAAGLIENKIHNETRDSFRGPFSNRAFFGKQRYPFMGSWQDTALRSMVIEAARNGEKYVTVPTAATQYTAWSQDWTSLYDKALKKEMEKLAKKHGGKYFAGWTNSTGIDPNKFSEKDRSEKMLQWHVLEITEEMREKLLGEGLPAWSVRAAQIKENANSKARSSVIKSSIYPYIDSAKQAALKEAKRILPDNVSIKFLDKIITADGGTAEGSAIYRLITLALDNFIEGKMDFKTAKKILIRTLRHEGLHSLRLLNLIKASEWARMVEDTKTIKVPGTNETYLQKAINLYKGLPDYGVTRIEEEAVAMMWEDYLDNPNIISKQSGGLVNDTIDLFRNIGKLLDGQGLRTTEDIFQSISSGEIAARSQGTVRDTPLINKKDEIQELRAKAFWRTSPAVRAAEQRLKDYGIDEELSVGSLQAIYEDAMMNDDPNFVNGPIASELDIHRANREKWASGDDAPNYSLVSDPSVIPTRTTYEIMSKNVGVNVALKSTAAIARGVVKNQGFDDIKRQQAKRILDRIDNHYKGYMNALDAPMRRMIEVITGQKYPVRTKMDAIGSYGTEFSDTPDVNPNWITPLSRGLSSAFQGMPQQDRNFIHAIFGSLLNQDANAAHQVFIIGNEDQNSSEVADWRDGDELPREMIEKLDPGGQLSFDKKDWLKTFVIRVPNRVMESSGRSKEDRLASFAKSTGFSATAVKHANETYITVNVWAEKDDKGKITTAHDISSEEIEEKVKLAAGQEFYADKNKDVFHGFYRSDYVEREQYKEIIDGYIRSRKWEGPGAAEGGSSTAYRLFRASLQDAAKVIKRYNAQGEKILGDVAEWADKGQQIAGLPNFLKTKYRRKDGSLRTSVFPDHLEVYGDVTPGNYLSQVFNEVDHETLYTALAPGISKGIGKTKGEKVKYLFPDGSTFYSHYGDAIDNPSYSLRNNRPDLPPEIQQAADRISPAREYRSWSQTILDLAKETDWDTFSTYFRQKFVNKYDRIEKIGREAAKYLGDKILLAENSALAAMLFADRARGVFAHIVREGGVIWKDGIAQASDLDLDGNPIKGLSQGFAPLFENGQNLLQAWHFYRVAKRESRFNAEGREVVTTPQERAYAQQLYNKYKNTFDEVDQWWENWNGMLVQYLVDTGVINENQAEEWVKHSDYIPFYRQIDGEETIGPKIFHSAFGVRPVPRAKGSKDTIPGSPLDTIAQNALAAITAGARNVAGQRVARDGTATGLMRRVYTPMQAGAHNANLPVDEHVSAEPIHDGLMTVRVNGEEHYYEVHDWLLVDSVQGAYEGHIPWLNFVALPSNILRETVTRDPGFIIANLARDTVSAWITSGSDYTPFWDTFKNFSGDMAGFLRGKESEELKRMSQAGVIGGYDYVMDPRNMGKYTYDHIRSAAGKNYGVLPTMKFVWEKLGQATTISDAATRQAVYNDVLAKTGSETEALFQALEVINFSRRGNSKLIRFVSAAIPFFNARIQGLDLIYRSLLAGTYSANQSIPELRANIAKRAWMRAMGMMFASIGYWYLVSDDDEWKNATMETRDDHWIIPTGTGVSVKIPIPFELGFLFKTMPERLFALGAEQDTSRDVLSSLFRGVTTSLNFNPFGIQAITPAYEAITNYSFFTGQEIVPSYMSDLKPEFQYRESTSMVARGIAAAVNSVLTEDAQISPMQADHIIRGYFGTLGTYATLVVDSTLRSAAGLPERPDMEITQYPVLKRFLQTEVGGGYEQKFYDIRSDVHSTVRTLNDLKKSGRYEDYIALFKERGFLIQFEKQFSRMDKTMRKFRNDLLQIERSRMDGEAKAKLIGTIKRARMRYLSNMPYMNVLIYEKYSDLWEDAF